MRRVSFPHGTVRCRPGVGLTFRVNMDDCLVVCEIARDALQELFGAPSASCDALVATFDAHRERIEEVARAYLERSDCVAGIHLTSTHFQQLEPT